MKKYPAAITLALAAMLSGCATSTPIQRYSESSSSFSTPPELITNTYAAKDIYRIYQRAATGFVSIQTLRDNVEHRAQEYAERQGKSFVVLGEQISHPPYILGNFPRIEIVFALIDKNEKPSAQQIPPDKYTQLEKLKKLLDEGAITKEEFDKEKAKILQ